jgi:hypothetical protein
MTSRRMKAFSAAATLRGICALGVATALLLGATGCAAPAPDASRAESNRKKQSELSEMEAIGQRNDDNAPIK